MPSPPIPSPSAICLVNSLVNATVGKSGFDVAGGSTITVSLTSSAGVSSWEIFASSADDQTEANGNLVALNNSKTQVTPFVATFVMPSLDGYGRGAGVQFTSTVNKGKPNENQVTFGVWVLNTNGHRLFFGGETIESNATVGNAQDLNILVTTDDGFIAGGDLRGSLTSQQVVSLTGQGGLVNIPTASLEFGAHSAAAQSGIFRFGDLTDAGQTDIITYRKSGTSDWPVLSISEDVPNFVRLQSFSDLNLVASSGKVLLQGVGGTNLYVAGGTVATTFASKFNVTGNAGHFALDGDANLTGWDININGGNLATIDINGVNIPNGKGLLLPDASAHVAAAGKIRFGNIASSAVTLIAGRNAANTADVSVIASDGSGDLIFGDQANIGVAALGGLVSARLTVNNAYNLGVNSSGNLSTYAVTGLTSAARTGPFTFDSDPSLTNWLFAINNVGSLNVRPTNTQLIGTNFLQFGPDATAAQAGLIRFQNVTASAFTVIGTRNAANSADQSLLWTDGGNNFAVGDYSFGVGQIFGGLAASLNCGGGNFQANTSSGGLISYILNNFHTQNVTGPFTFDSDANLTSWQFNIHTTPALTITSTGITLPGLSTAGILHNSSTGVVTSSLIVNADVSASAAIAGTKVSPAFGTQALSTSGAVTLTGTSINLGTSTAAVSINGGISYNLITATGSQTLDATQKYYYILVDTTSGAITLTLPTPSAGRVWKFKHVGGNLATNSLTFARHGSESIDGLAASRVITANGWSGELSCDGVNWFISS